MNFLPSIATALVGSSHIDPSHSVVSMHDGAVLVCEKLSNDAVHGCFHNYARRNTVTFPLSLSILILYAAWD
ncbi:MAG: hypothetical protein P4M11_14370 [Candidatus Pacebacteria bacterium]|nr:hypothetical protein [Candidatus Paceibacterota bacterium]